MRKADKKCHFFLYEYFNTFAQYTVYISNNVNAKKLFSCASAVCIHVKHFYELKIQIKKVNISKYRMEKVLSNFMNFNAIF